MLTAPSWQPETPIEAVIFDCDGTLTAIEGIDELARQNDVGAVVEALTHAAMSHAGLNPDLYRERVELVLPRQEQVLKLGALYYDYRAPDSDAVIKLLQTLGKSIFIMSAGLRPAVSVFGERFAIPDTNIFAVDITFDAEGNYSSFDATSPLTTGDGKRTVVTYLQSMYSTVAHIGDGLNDLVVRDLVTRFVGYGGFFYRENIAAGCEYYMKAKSLISLLPLLLTKDEVNGLDQGGKELYRKGLDVITHQSSYVQDTESDGRGRLIIG